MDRRALKDKETLNQTSDFQSGCTPYKKVAAHVVSKSKNKLTTKARGKKGPGAKSTLPSISSSCTVITADQNKGAILGGVGAEGLDAATVFDESLKAKTTLHEVKKSETGVVGSSQSGSIAAETESAVRKQCSTCGAVTINFLEHIKVCLKQQFARNPTKSSGKNADDDTQMASGKAESPLTYCAYCKKDLKPLSFARRQQHINRCLDKSESQKQASGAGGEVSDVRPVSDCPLCGLALQTEAARRKHLKQCARQLQVPSHVLLARVKQQQREEKETSRQATENRASDTRLDRKSQRGRKRTNPGRRKEPQYFPEAPRSKFDEDTQMALALSTSIQQTETESQQQPTQNSSQDFGKELQNAFKLLMTPKNKDLGAPKKRGKSKKAPVTYLLLHQTPQERLEKVQKRMADLLLPQTEPAQVDLTLPYSSLGVILGCSLWSKLIPVSGQHTQKQDMYYVAALMPPIEVCRVTVGSKMKLMSSIPGWQPLDTTVKPGTATSVCDGDVSRLSVNPDVTMPLIASTQTAATLAELAAEAGSDITMSGQPHTQSTGRGSGTPGTARTVTAMEVVSTPDLSATAAAETSGFCVVSEANLASECAVDTLLGNLRRLLDNPEYSDLNIRTGDGRTVHCHRAIVALRCPALLQLLGDLDAPNPVEWPHDAMMVVLRFIYAADLAVPGSLAKQVKAAAESLGLSELSSACVGGSLSTRGQFTEGVTSPGPDTGADVLQQTVDAELNAMLAELWPEEDSDSETDTDRPESAADTAREERESDEFVELYEYMAATQQQRLAGKKPEDDSEDNEEEEEENDRDPSSDADTVRSQVATPKTVNQSLREALEKSFLEDVMLFGDTGSPGDVNQLTPTAGHGDIAGRNIGGTLSEIEEEEDGEEEEEEQEIQTERNSATPIAADTCADGASDTDPLSDNYRQSRQCMNRDSTYEDDMERDTKQLQQQIPQLEEDGVILVTDDAGQSGTERPDTSPCSSLPDLSQSPHVPDCPTPTGSLTEEDLFDSVLEDSPWQPGGQSESNSRHLIRDSLLGQFQGTAPRSQYQDETRGQVDKDIRDDDAAPVSPQDSVCENDLGRGDDDLGQDGDDLDQDDNDLGQGDDDLGQGDTGLSQNYDDLGQGDNDLDQGDNHLGQGDIDLNQSDHDLGQGDDDLGQGDDDLGQGDDLSDSMLCCVVGETESHTATDVGRTSPTYTATDETSSPASQASPVRPRCRKPATRKSVQERSFHTQSNSSQTSSSRKRKRATDVLWSASNSISDKTDVRKRLRLGDEDSIANTSRPSGSEEESLPTISHRKRRRSSVRCSLSHVDIATQEDEKSTSQLGGNDASDNLSSSMPAKFHNSSLSDDMLPYVKVRDVNPLTQKKGNVKKFMYKAKNVAGDTQVGASDSQEDTVITGGMHLATGHTQVTGAKDTGKRQGMPLESQITSPKRRVPPKTSAELSPEMERMNGEDVAGILNTSYNIPDSHELVDLTTYDPPTDMETDVSGLLAGNDSFLSPSGYKLSKQRPPGDQVTSGQRSQTKPRKVLPPSPFTPMANYSTMPTPHLKKACQKVGLRPQPKKKMISMLKHVYEETHKYESDSDETPNSQEKHDAQDSQRKQKPKKQSATDTRAQKNKNSKEGRHNKKALESKNTASVTNCSPPQSNSEDESDLPSSQTSDTDAVELPEESILCDDTASRGKMSKRDIKAKHQMIRDYLTSEEEIHLQILHYEPLDLFELHRSLKSATGVAMGLHIIKDFLDEQNILFTEKNGPTSRGTRRARKLQKNGKKSKSAGVTDSQSSQASRGGR